MSIVITAAQQHTLDKFEQKGYTILKKTLDTESASTFPTLIIAVSFDSAHHCPPRVGFVSANGTTRWK